MGPEDKQASSNRERAARMGAASGQDGTFRAMLTLSWLTLAASAVAAECPDQSPELQPWSPGHDPGHRVHIGRGRTLLLTSSATVNSIHVSEGGKLVIKDQDEAIVLRTRHILVDNGGELHAGSALCPYQGNFSIVLYGRADEGIQPDPYFGLKYIGVGRGGVLELHGQKKLSWTFLNKTLHPGGMQEGGYFFERSWGHRGVIVHIIDPKSATVIHSDRNARRGPCAGQSQRPRGLRSRRDEAVPSPPAVPETTGLQMHYKVGSGLCGANPRREVGRPVGIRNQAGRRPPQHRIALIKATASPGWKKGPPNGPPSTWREDLSSWWHRLPPPLVTRIVPRPQMAAASQGHLAAQEWEDLSDAEGPAPGAHGLKDLIGTPR
uniref:cell migration-inducing and hyaluronan-binding protein-like n=1 Tax=Panthera onca TaxID=9690 RepID=UPI002953DD9A|nr:cell migration-inducing and hyaluronan-binding protein-like [Panthera onca]